MTTSNKVARGRSTAVKAQIDENLKRVYQDALDAEVPDRFKQLLEQLRQAETAGRHAGGDDDLGSASSSGDLNLQSSYFPTQSGAAHGNATSAGGGGSDTLMAAGPQGGAPRTRSESIE